MEKDRWQVEDDKGSTEEDNIKSEPIEEVGKYENVNDAVGRQTNTDAERWVKRNSTRLANLSIRLVAQLPMHQIHQQQAQSITDNLPILYPTDSPTLNEGPTGSSSTPQIAQPRITDNPTE